MPTLDTIRAAFTPSRPATPAAAAGPLAPAFDRASARRKAAIAETLDESMRLAKNFKACLMEVAFANVNADADFWGYGTHKPMTSSVSLPLPNDRLDLVVALNVSGHDFKTLPNREQLLADRAKNNRYVIQVTHPDGRVERMAGIEAKGALSTAQDISVRGIKPGKLVVEAWPEGSAGVGGYIEGRRLEITVTGA
jgi:hypothetical protein